MVRVECVTYICIHLRMCYYYVWLRLYCSPDRVLRPEEAFPLLRKEEDGALYVELQEGRSDDKLFCGLYSNLTISLPLFPPTSPSMLIYFNPNQSS
jgi:hypothetical protein